MLKAVFTAVIFLGAVSLLSAQKLHRAEFGEEIDDWFIFDLDNDGNREILALFKPTKEGRPFAVATFGPEGYTIERGVLDRRVVTLAVGSFGFGPGQQLALIHPDRVRFLGRDKDKKLSLMPQTLSFRCIIRSPLAGAPGFWHWATDVDNDGHDDLYLPGDEGIIVHYGSGDGSFSEPQLLPFTGSRRIEDDSTGHLDFERSYSRPAFIDVTGDQLRDLCWFDEKGLAFIPQDRARSFRREGRFSFDLEWLSGQEAGGILEQTEIELEDMNGDGLPDLFLSKMSTPASGITNMKTTLVILLNQGEGRFGKRPDFALVVRGVIGNGPKIEDLNGDGRADLVFGSYGTSVADALQRAMGNIQVKFNLYLARDSKETPFLAQPDTSQEFKISKRDYEKWGVRTNVQLDQDLNNDGIADLLTIVPGKGGHQLEVRPGQKDKSGMTFAEEAALKVFESGIEDVTLRAMTPDGASRVVLIKKDSIVMISPR